MNGVRKIELLSPAKDAATGMEAILHGADAVYIGADKFGARASAGNSIDEIKRLCDFAHIYYAKVYVTVNTILKDSELEQVRQMITELYRIGVDGLIVQDMSIAEMDIPPIELHASTQTDNRTADKVKFFEDIGFTRVVLARELSLQQIKEIHDRCNVELEVFVHGALCVSYSGQCYISQACFGRSANRGECAQFCRLPLTLKDGNGRILCRNKHLLSLKDMNRTGSLEELLDAGVTSLKIEGRLKDVSYVKNVTAHYRQQLDEIFSRRKEYARSSSGISELSFVPDPRKSFSRGFTDYFLHGRTHDLYSPDTPKSIGEKIGVVSEVKADRLRIAGKVPIANGDGLCYRNGNNELCGFRVNRAENDGVVFPQKMPLVKKGTDIYRNYDSLFEKTLSKKSAVRLIGVDIELTENAFGYALSLCDEDGVRVSVSVAQEKIKADNRQTDLQKRELSKLGNTPFRAKEVSVSTDGPAFIPLSVLSAARRKAVESLLSAREMNRKVKYVKVKRNDTPYPGRQLDYRGNVMNSLAGQFYTRHGTDVTEDAFECGHKRGKVLMTCRHCIRYAMNMCPKENRGVRHESDWYIETSDKRRFRLLFDCKACEMKVIDCD